VDDCQCGYITKLRKRNLATKGKKLCPSILRTCLLLICSLASKSSICSYLWKGGREDLMVQSTHVTWHNKSCLFCMQWYYHTQNWRVESPISQNLNAKWSFFWVSREGTRWLWSRKEITFHTHRIWSCNTSLRTYHVYMHKKHLFILLRCSIPFTMVINNTKLRD
jgi:hypothetical protein